MTRPQDLAPGEAAAWLQEADAPTIVDVRTPAEFHAAHIDGAVNVPLDLVEQHPAEIAAHLDREVLLVCHTDQRAHRAAGFLADQLKVRGHVLSGGMAQWRSDGLPVVEGDGTWAMDRQVRTVAGGVALASVLASLKAPRARFVAGGIGAGLLWSGLSNTCAMASVLQRMPWNRGLEQPSLADVTAELDQKEN